MSGILAGLLVFGVGGWAVQAKLAGAVVAQGQLVVPDQVKTIQHRDGGLSLTFPWPMETQLRLVTCFCALMKLRLE